MSIVRGGSWIPTVRLADCGSGYQVGEVDELREMNKAIRRQLVDQENTIRQLRSVILDLRKDFEIARA